MYLTGSDYVFAGYGPSIRYASEIACCTTEYVDHWLQGWTVVDYRLLQWIQPAAETAAGCYQDSRIRLRSR